MKIIYTILIFIIYVICISCVFGIFKLGFSSELNFSENFSVPLIILFLFFFRTNDNSFEVN